MQGQLRTSQTKMTDQTAVWLLYLSVISLLIRLAGVQKRYVFGSYPASFLIKEARRVMYYGTLGRDNHAADVLPQTCPQFILTSTSCWSQSTTQFSILTSALLFAPSSPHLHCTPWHWIISPLCLRNLPKTWLVKLQRRILVPSITAETLIYGKVYGSRMILDMPCRCKPISLLINLFWSFRSRLPSRYLRRLRMTFAGDLKYDYNKNQHFRALYIYCFD